MKARLILWTMLTAAVAATVTIVWFHLSTSSPVKSEAQNCPSDQIVRLI
jgi:RNAse (barnase) inhibitor barstar